MAKKNLKGFKSISIFSMVVGIVVGVGIFAKNQEVFIKAEQNIGIAIGAWLVVGIIVVMMAISYVEISSVIREKTHGSGFLAWSSKLMNRGFATTIGSSIAFFLMPAGVVIISWYMSGFFLDGVFANYNISSSSQSDYKAIFQPLIVLVVNISLFLSMYFRNRMIFFVQQIITFLKFIPLLLVLILGLILPFVDSSLEPGLTNEAHWVTEKIDSSNNIEKDFLDYFIALLLTLPPIMYAVDGFLYSTNIQQETKNKKVFIKGFIAGIIFIIVFYIIFTLSTFNLGDASTSPGTTFFVGTLFSRIFNNPITNTIMLFVVSLSAFGVLTGMWASGSRSFSTLSKEDLISDRTSSIAKVTKKGIPLRSIKIFAATIIFWFIVIVSAEVINYLISKNEPDSLFKFGDVVNQLSNANSLFIFVIYALLIFFGLRNRKTKKVEVDKVKFFVPASVIALVFVFVTFLVNIFDYFGILYFVVKKGTSFSDGLKTQIILYLGIIVCGISSVITAWTKKKELVDASTIRR